MSTRIVLLHYQDAGSEGCLLGLMVQQATFTFRAEPEEFTPPGIEVGTAPYLGPVLSDDEGIVQLIEVQRLLPPEVKEQLFLHAAAAGQQEAE